MAIGVWPLDKSRTVGSESNNGMGASKKASCVKPQSASGGISLQCLYPLPKSALSRRGALLPAVLSGFLLLWGGDKQAVICLNLLCAVVCVITAAHRLPGTDFSPGAQGWYYSILKRFNASIKNVINIQLTSVFSCSVWLHLAALC